MVIIMSSDFWTTYNSGNDNEMVHGKALRLHKSAALVDLLRWSQLIGRHEPGRHSWRDRYRWSESAACGRPLE